MNYSLNEMVSGMMELDDDSRRKLASKTLATLSFEHREQAVEELGGVMPHPSQKVANAIWVMVFAFLFVVIGGGAVIGWIADGGDESALYGFVGIALGAVVGILSPSPSATK